MYLNIVIEYFHLFSFSFFLFLFMKETGARSNDTVAVTQMGVALASFVRLVVFGQATGAKYVSTVDLIRPHAFIANPFLRAEFLDFARLSDPEFRYLRSRIHQFFRILEFFFPPEHAHRCLFTCNKVHCSVHQIFSSHQQTVSIQKKP